MAASRFRGKISRQVANGRQDDFGASGTQPCRRGEGSEHADGAHVGSPGHLDVFRRIADIDGFFGESAQALQGKLERRGIGLSPARIVTANADSKIGSQSEVAELLSDTPAAAT